MMKENTARRWGLSSFALHLAAMALMLCDHLWGSFLGNVPALGYVGRIAFPLYAFMLTEGFRRTGNRKKYALRMLVFALISEIPFDLLMEHTLVYPFRQNVLFTLLLGIGLMWVYEAIRKCRYLLARLALYALATLGGFLLGFLGFVDYFGHGILMVALFWFIRPDRAAKPWQKLLLCLAQAVALYWICCQMIKGMMIPISVFGFRLEVYKQGFALLALPLIWLYNGRQGLYGKWVKNVYYWFYPVHMLILGGLITLL